MGASEIPGCSDTGAQQKQQGPGGRRASVLAWPHYTMTRPRPDLEQTGRPRVQQGSVDSSAAEAWQDAWARAPVSGAKAVLAAGSGLGAVPSVFLSLGIFHFLPLWIVILAQKLIG